MDTPKSSSSDFQKRLDEFSRARKERSLEFLKSFGYPVEETRRIPPPAAPPSFPTLLELVEDSKQPPPPKKEKGVFEELLRGRVDVLLQDALESRSEYDDEVLALLHELYLNRLKLEELTPEQRLLLDAATMKFFSRPEVNNPDVHHRAPKKLWKPPVEIAPEAASFQETEEAAPLGEDGLPAFWWLKE